MLTSFKNMLFGASPVVDPNPTSWMSYAQSGEDMILSFASRYFGIKNGFYLDIGAHHPTYLSNTYGLYLQGWRGVCVEPQTTNNALFKELRPHDHILNSGAGLSAGELIFFEIDPPTLSTFDRQFAELAEQQGHQIVREVKIPVLSVEDLIAKIPEGKKLDLLSIDIEGHELPIVQRFSELGQKPSILVCETVRYAKRIQDAKKDLQEIETLKALGYQLYADTFMNSIFISQELWDAP